MKHLHRRCTPPDTKRQVGEHDHPGGENRSHVHREANLHECVNPMTMAIYDEALTRVATEPE